MTKFRTVEEGLFFITLITKEEDGEEKVGVAIVYNEAEVNHRLQILKKMAEQDPSYQDVVDEIEEFHRKRREANTTIEMVLGSPQPPMD